MIRAMEALRSMRDKGAAKALVLRTKIVLLISQLRHELARRTRQGPGV